MDWAEGGSELMKIDLFIDYIIKLITLVIAFAYFPFRIHLPNIYMCVCACVLNTFSVMERPSNSDL